MTDRSAAWHALIRRERTNPAARLARAGLWWARLPYGAGVWVRNRAFDRGWKKAARLPVPVVCVGNLTVGGTGKTPVVEAVARFYRDLGLQVAIVSRGYGSEAGRNDEAMVLEENLPDVPHLQGADRVAVGLTAVAELDSEVIVLDDGFQHRRLARDLDVVLVDATRPLADEYLFPRGMLREPVSGLRRAGVLVLTRCDQATPDSVAAQREWLAKRCPGVTLAETVHAPVELLAGDGRTVEVGELQGRTVGAFCGVGNPESVRRTLDGLGATVAAFRPFRDHHPYTRTDVDDLARWAATLPADAWVVTTQKDLVKLRVAELAGRPVWAVRIGIRFRSGEEAFHDRLRAVIPESAAS
ncbi:MAG: tetraacyldisaccharide 4'-kinase [Gemmataceae bacterium]